MGMSSHLMLRFCSRAALSRPFAAFIAPSSLPWGQAYALLASGAAAAYAAVQVDSCRQQCCACETSATSATRTEPTNFHGRTAVVTGAGGGIGLAIARRLAQANAKVILLDLDSDRLHKAAAEIGGIAISCDLRDMDGTKAKLEAVGILEKTDLLVNCAGVAIFKPLPEINKAIWDITMDVNAYAYLALAQMLSPGMASRGGGAIVNISSQSSTVVVGPGHTCYSTSKAAVDHISKALAINLAKSNIRCNAVNPTVVKTELAIKAHGEEGLKKMAAKVPLQRVCEPDNVADVVLFLLSDCASMVSGAILPVDGGFLASRQ